MNRFFLMLFFCLFIILIIILSVSMIILSTTVGSMSLLVEVSSPMVSTVHQSPHLCWQEIFIGMAIIINYKLTVYKLFFEILRIFYPEKQLPELYFAKHFWILGPQWSSPSYFIWNFKRFDCALLLFVDETSVF